MTSSAKIPILDPALLTIVYPENWLLVRFPTSNVRHFLLKSVIIMRPFFLRVISIRIRWCQKHCLTGFIFLLSSQNQSTSQYGLEVPWTSCVKYVPFPIAREQYITHQFWLDWNTTRVSLKSSSIPSLSLQYYLFCAAFIYLLQPRFDLLAAVILPRFGVLGGDGDGHGSTDSLRNSFSVIPSSVGTNLYGLYDLPLSCTSTNCFSFRSTNLAARTMCGSVQCRKPTMTASIPIRVRPHFFDLFHAHCHPPDPSSSWTLSSNRRIFLVQSMLSRLTIRTKSPNYFLQRNGFVRWRVVWQSMSSSFYAFESGVLFFCARLPVAWPQGFSATVSFSEAATSSIADSSLALTSWLAY